MTTENIAAVETAEVAATALSFKDKAIAFASDKHNQKVAAIGGGIAVAGLALWGAKKLWDRRKAKKESEGLVQAAGELRQAAETIAQ